MYTHGKYDFTWEFCDFKYLECLNCIVGQQVTIGVLERTAQSQ